MEIIESILSSSSSLPSSSLYVTPFLSYFVYKLISYFTLKYQKQLKYQEMKNKAILKASSRNNKKHFTLELNSKINELFIDEDGQSLQEKIVNNEISCVDLLILCSKRSNTIGKQLNAITEEPYDDALQLAQALELRRNSTNNNQLIPRKEEILLGIPISIKDGFQQAGYDCTMGTAARCFQPYSEDGLLVKALKHAGALPFVRSNIPQLLMMPESENAIWGICANPWDITRTSGGSSGGEASLISARCSVCGLGSDIGGSIRIPAHYTGICGFKPTPPRMSLRGQSVPRKNDRNGQIVIRSTSGPMARRLFLFYFSFLSSQNFRIILLILFF